MASFKSSLLLLSSVLSTAILAQSSTAPPTTAVVTSGPTSTSAGIVVATSDTSPSQRSAFNADVQSYLQSFRDSPEFSSVAINLLFNLPASVRNSLQSDPYALLPVTGTVDLHSIATNPPLSFPTTGWETYLSGAPLSQVQSLQTSAVLQVASIAQHNLGVTASISVPSASTGAAPRATAMGGLMGAAGLAVGAAAIML